MHLGKVDRENVEMIQHYKKNPDIQKALDVLEKYCEEKSLSKKNVPEIQQNLNRKKKQQSIQRGLYDRSPLFVPNFGYQEETNIWQQR